MPRLTSSPNVPGGNPPPEFSLVVGGPLFQLMRRGRISDDAMGLMRRRIIVISLFCWLPLFVLSALQGQLLDAGIAVPFLMDIEVHVRFLVVVPMLIGAELVVHRRTRFLVAQFLERNLVAEQDMPRFQAAIESAMRLRNSITAEIMLIAGVYAVGILFIYRHYVALDAQTWLAVESGDGSAQTLAGIWFTYLSLPIFQFLLLRWYFRIFIWARLMWHVSRIDLRLMPGHPDRVGGLGFLSAAVDAYVPVLMAIGALFAGFVADRIFHLGAVLTDFKLEAFVLVIFLLCLVQGPLLVFSPQLARARRMGKREYGVLVQDYVRVFDEKWLRGGRGREEQFLGNADFQSMADLSASYETVDSMRITLVSRSAILTFAVAILLPSLPLTLTMMPLEELLGKLFGILF